MHELESNGYRDAAVAYIARSYTHVCPVPVATRDGLGNGGAMIDVRRKVRVGPIHTNLKACPWAK
jgi:hypothetical protein